MDPRPKRAYDRREPCAQCPYRRDAPLAKWHPDHFVDLIKNDRSEIGKVYNCHNRDGNICVGWGLNQRDRNTPSIALRLLLRSDPEAARQYGEITDGGHALFGSVEEMCTANLRAAMQDEESEAHEKGDEYDRK